MPPATSGGRRRRGVAGVLLVLSALACRNDKGGRGSTAADAAADAQPADGPGPTDVADAQGEPFAPSDGSRLKARWMEGPDGTRTFWGWYDTSLRAPCRFGWAADGQIRCLPEGPVLTTTPTEFADAACITRAFVRPFRSCEPPEAHAVLWDYTTDRCRARERIFRVGERIGDNRIFQRITGQCQAVEQPTTSAVFRVGEELPPTTFVKAERVVAPTSAASASVQLVLLAGEDGARDRWGWRLASPSADCSVEQLADDRWHCVPPLAPINDGWFAEATCTQPVASFDPACGSPAHIRQILPGMCAPRARVLDLGATVPAPYSRGAMASCGNSLVVLGIESHALGPPLPDDRFPTMDIVGEPTMQRLQRRKQVAPDGTSVTWGWFDRQRNEPCSPLLFQGKRLCVPSSQSFADWYADAGCKTPLWRSSSTSCPDRFVVGNDYSVCPQRRILFAVGARHDGPAFRLTLAVTGARAAYECRPVAPGPGDALYALAPIPDEQQAELKLIEPF
jgi:hypothetical protein